MAIVSSGLKFLNLTTDSKNKCHTTRAKTKLDQSGVRPQNKGPGFPTEFGIFSATVLKWIVGVRLCPVRRQFIWKQERVRVRVSLTLET